MNKIGIDMPEVVSTQTNPQENLSNEPTILLDGKADVEKGAKMTDNNTNDNNAATNDSNINININKDSNNATDKNSLKMLSSITDDDNDETKKNEKKNSNAAVEEENQQFESTNSVLEESPKAVVAPAVAAAPSAGSHTEDNDESRPTNAVGNNHVQLEDEHQQDFSSPTESLPNEKVKETSSLHDDSQPASQKENGTMENCDGAVVDLGDDTDEEEQPTSKGEVTISKIIPNAVESNRKATTTPTTSTTIAAVAVAAATKANSVPTDTAVVIASDSDTEEVPSKKQAEAAKKTEITDDDDDDCVVIEDSTPISSDLNKRKSISVDESFGDDNQPPMKRIRGNMDSNMSRQDNSVLKKSPDNASVYPVTITPASNVNSQGPPKMMAVPNLPNNVGMGLSAGSNNNSSLLPGLTDDMFVLEAPSFIVPYIYEKPPAVTLTNIIKDIETLFSLSKEDLAEADKTDEFDMITEQNKSDKVDSETKKKKKRWAGDDGDDSWSEQSEEEEDEDEDSESGVRTKVLIKEASDDISAFKGAIKPAAVVSQVTANTTPGAPGAVVAKPGQENYFESPLGKFFMDIGVGLVQEFVQSDLIRLQKRKMRKSLGKNTMEFERAISALSGNLEASKKKNSPYKFTMKRCEFCNFKSESALAMANHYETPHMNGALYKCNFCNFEIRNATEIVYHMEAVHNIKARLIKPLPYHQCPNCGFEDNGKAKLARHQPVCAKKFRPELNLAPPNDWEAPAKIPRIKPRHGLVGTATAYQAMAAQAAAQKAALASIQQQQQAAARSLQAATMAAQNAANKMRGRAPIVQRQIQNPGGMIRPTNTIRTPNMASNLVISNSYQLTNNQLLQASNTMNKKPLSGQPSISITPLPRQSNAPPTASMPSTSSKVPQAGAKPGQSPGGSKAQFVICEICDGYIKDLEQLRNHMQWMHKVKIHPKMIYNRPPLNCQKCQFRFFTDQGLERHLLGSHGLVTSSMQEAANKGKDSGRCPVCGRMYQWKLLNHVSRDHHMTLKPAHLSYKCTVCTATFGMYKQFETHVYTAHSTVAKRAMDGKKSNTPGPSSSNSSGGGQRPTTANDSILKPLKINDEITIIPQPATKPRITNMESHVID